MVKVPVTVGVEDLPTEQGMSVSGCQEFAAQ